MTSADLVVCAGVIVLGIAAFEDIHRRILRNRYVLLSAILGLASLWRDGTSMVLMAVGFAVALFICLWLLVTRGYLGGGDAKMIPAACLLTSPQHVPALIVTIGLCGAVLAIAFLILARMLPRPVRGMVRYDGAPEDPWSITDQVAAGIPYGVAIWLGLTLVSFGH